jgi:hypothetical protein
MALFDGHREFGVHTVGAGKFQGLAEKTDDREPMMLCSLEKP